jgi:hypothetical protein
LSASLIFSAATYAVTRSPSLSVANFLAGIFLDLDHVPEYFIKNRLTKSPSSFFTEEMHLDSKKTVLLLHGFDIITLCFGLLYLSGLHALSWALYVGALQHLLLDFIYNPIKTPWAFFLAYRIRHHFDTDEIYHRMDTKSFWEKKKKNFFT